MLADSTRFVDRKMAQDCGTVIHFVLTIYPDSLCIPASSSVFDNTAQPINFTAVGSWSGTETNVVQHTYCSMQRYA